MSYLPSIKWGKEKPNYVLCLIVSLFLFFGLTPTSSMADDLKAMGDNSYGQLGDGTTTERSTPVRVVTGVSQVAAGGGHSLFVKTDGALWATGNNFYGQLGDGTTTNRSTPVEVATEVSQVTGCAHSLL